MTLVFSILKQKNNHPVIQSDKTIPFSTIPPDHYHDKSSQRSVVFAPPSATQTLPNRIVLNYTANTIQYKQTNVFFHSQSNCPSCEK